ncbi:FAD-dependent oxidoreductase [Shumkonia mesophila]|uniref:FAD-dependent oxidoreductase n=1 Tax=Shumkonia mesophila TaxID=2838854 RepID=UPI0029343ABD|nr:FAD-dependent oxidoreductase [Shumkonia mesophila]
MTESEILTNEKVVREPSRATPIVREVDVLVCGGGLSGIGAALGAARAGARTLIVERNAGLGGAATATLMNTWNVPVERMTGVAQEIAHKLAEQGAGVVGGPTFPFNPEQFKELSVQLISEAGAEILNYTWVVDPIMVGNRLRGVIVQNKSGRQAILAKTVIDTTGDADIVALAGGEHVKGREKDGKMRPMSVLFRLGGVDIKRAVDYCRQNPQNFTADPNFHILDIDHGLVRLSGFFDIAEKARAAGELPDEIHYIRMEGIDVARGVVMVNNSRVYGVDGTNAWDITRADLQARRQNRMVFDVIRKYIPGFEKAWVIDSSANIGVRETRRARGPKLVSQDDFQSQRRWPDSVVRIWRHMAAGRDWHKADGGEGAPGDAVYRTATTQLTWFELPWGIFTPNRVEGLLVAGRTLSVTHDADMWTRGQYCCLVTGQVSGVAAALAASRDMSPSVIEVADLQQSLRAQDIDIGEAGERLADGGECRAAVK